MRHHRHRQNNYGKARVAFIARAGFTKTTQIAAYEVGSIKRSTAEYLWFGRAVWSGRGTGVRLLIVIRLLFLATCTYPTPRDKHSSAFAGALLNGSSGIRVWRKPIKRKYLQSFVIPLGGIREGLRQTLREATAQGVKIMTKTTPNS